MHCGFLSNSFLYLTQVVAIYTIMLLSYLMLVIYISVPVWSLCLKGQNTDEKYDQCILYFLRRVVCKSRHLPGSKSSWLM